MKKFTVSPASVFSFLLFPILFLFLKFQRKYRFLYLLVIALLFTGCYLNFFRTNTRNGLDKSTISALKNKNKYFIVHLKDGNYALKNISVNNNVVDADVEPLSDYHTKYLHPAAGTYPTYKKKDVEMLSEIHLYAESENLESHSHLTIPVKSVKRVDVYEEDIGKTRANHIMSTIGIIAGVGLLLGIVLLATAPAPQPTPQGNCNCPQVYTYDGGQYQFKSGVFSGAVYSSLEKTDYLPLENLKDVNGKYLFRLMNNQQEEQFVNQLQLIKVAHDPATNILLDRHGAVHNYKQLAPPISTSLKNDETGEVLKLRDGNAFIFNEKADAASDFGSIILTFDKPVNAKQAKLIVNAKNSLWSGYLFDEFSSLFGDKFQKYTAKQDKADKQKIERWQKEQALPLMTYVETDKGWQPIDYFSITGNTAGRDMIMSVNIPDTKNNKIRIKLESAYMFWELDYAAMDFSPDYNFKPELINASTAIKSDETNSQVANLMSKDDQYSKLLQNEFITVEFKKPSQVNGQQNSYFLVSTGYYHSLKEYTGKADVRKLNHFKKKGAFSEFSEKRYIEAQKLLAKGIDLQSHQ